MEQVERKFLSKIKRNKMLLMLQNSGVITIHIKFWKIILTLLRHQR